MKKPYLCGPILGCTDEECKDWRYMARKELPDSLDPMRRDYRGKELDSYIEIVEQDKLDILNCDCVLVNYTKPSVGTSMEILFAWEQHKPVIVVAAQGVVISPWLKYHTSHFFESFSQALHYIKYYGK